MLHKWTQKVGLSALVVTGMVFASNAAMAGPTLTITAEAFDSGNNSLGTLVNSATDPGIETTIGLSDFSSGGFFGYRFSVAATATDGAVLDELFDIEIATTTSEGFIAGNRIEFTVSASGYTGQSGPTLATTVTTPTNIGGDLDLVSTVAGTTVLNAQNIASPNESGSVNVNLTSPYSITHVINIQHTGAATTSTDTTTQVVPVPVPATLGLLGVGLIGLGALARRPRIPA